MTNPNRAFWDEHGRVGLVWSNPNATDDALISAALLKQPNFHLLLDIAEYFGLPRLQMIWKQVRQGIEARQYPEEIRQFERAKPIVERCLGNMEAALCQKI